jgi:hypothetical protein
VTAVALPPREGILSIIFRTQIKSRNEEISAFFCTQNLEKLIFKGFSDFRNGSCRERKEKK